MSDKEQEKSPELVTDQEKDLAQNALTEFRRRNYNSCFQFISKLENRTNDLKVVHNKAVVEFYKCDCKKVDQLQKTLIEINNQFQIKIEKLDDIDHCVLQFNLAVLLYHQKQFTASQRIMDKVYKFIEPMDESLVKQVNLLAIELQLCLRDSEKALTLISYLENNLMYGGSIPLKALDRKEKKVQLPPPKPLSEDFQRKLLKYKIRCYIMNHSLSTAMKETQVLLKDKSNIDAMFLAANIEYLKGNYKDAIKILGSVPKDALIYGDCGESSTVMFYNNMGVIHHAMGKPNLACHYFQMALKDDMKNTTQSNRKEKPLHNLGGSKYHELVYNLGIALLHAKRPVQAFDCLIIAVRRYHRNSRLWLRLAECCIMVHKETNEIDFEKQKRLIIDIIGTKDKQKIVLTSHLSQDKKYSVESHSYAVPVPTLEFAQLCLRNAILLAPTADGTGISGSQNAAAVAPLFLAPGSMPPAPPPGPTPCPSSPLGASVAFKLEAAVLTAASYVALCLGDYQMALNHSKDLLKLRDPIAPPGYRLLAHMYAAEALVLLDKMSEAMEHLNPEHIKSISFDDERSVDDSWIKTTPPFKWFPNNLSTAHAVLQYNIAVVKTIRGQLDQAAAILKQVWQQRSSSCQVPSHIIMLFIYIELQLGHTDVAKNLIRQYSYQHRLTG